MSEQQQQAFLVLRAASEGSGITEPSLRRCTHTITHDVCTSKSSQSQLPLLTSFHPLNTPTLLVYAAVCFPVFKFRNAFNSASSQNTQQTQSILVATQNANGTLGNSGFERVKLLQIKRIFLLRRAPASQPWSRDLNQLLLADVSLLGSLSNS